MPAASSAIVYQPLDIGGEPYRIVCFDFNTGIWEALGDTANNLGIVLPIRLITQTAVGLKKVSAKNELELVRNHPNPFKDITTIQFRTSETDNLSLEIRYLTGKLILNKDLIRVAMGITQTYTFQRSNMKAGVYRYTLKVQIFSFRES